MSGSIMRRPVTRWFLDYLRDSSSVRAELMSAEDHDGLKTLGWQNEPNRPGAVFEPYTILVPQTSTRNYGAIGHNVSDWSFTYLSTVFGTSVDQAEDVSDVIRQICTPFRPGDRPQFTMNGVAWYVARVDCTSIGGVGWNNQISPAMYSQTDSYEVSIGRSSV